MADTTMTHDWRLRERFWVKVRKTDCCWEWTASKNKFGNGNFVCALDGGRSRSALSHRISWILERGPIPPNLKVLHRCDNPSCVRPGHLFLGTQADNMRDMLAKGRSAHSRYRDYLPRGEGHAFFHLGRKLTRKQAKEIRSSADSPIELALRFSVSQSTISRIRTGDSWRDPAPGSSVMGKLRVPILPRPTMEQRFWSKVAKTNDCWFWIGGVNATGYGTFQVPAKPRWQSKLAHRVSWEIANGRAIPSGLVILHACDNAACVNPAHLSIGTQGDNIANMIAKGRQRPADDMRGERNPMHFRGHKLTRKDAYKVRSEVGTIYEVGARWGISASMVSLIRRGEAWTDRSMAPREPERPAVGQQ